MDYFCVLTAGGVVLYSKSWGGALKGHPHPVDDLVSSVLLEERRSQQTYNSGTYSLRWHLDNAHRLVFVVAYNKYLQLPVSYTSDVMAAAASLFVATFREQLESAQAFRLLKPSAVQEAFGPKFERLYNKLQSQADFCATGSASPQAAAPSPAAGDSSPEASSTPTAEAAMPLCLASSKTHKAPHAFVKKQKAGAKSPKTPKKGKGKEMRVWEDQFAAGDEREFNKGPDLDLSSSGEQEAEILDELKFDVESDMVTYEGDGDDAEDEEELAEHIKKGREARLRDGAKEAGGKGRSAAAGMWSFFGGIALGGRELTRSDIEPVVAKFSKHLQQKNVAVDITERLCESVTESLVGKKLGTFEGVSRAVKASLQDSLTRILTPRRDIDLIRDITAHRRARPGVPYSVVFMGCNGVGKSTNLAKIGSYLRKSGFSVMFAACDTFRSGAVEQLKVHSRRLGIALYEKGYGRDDTGIAQDALAQATAEHTDVVLIDTAGRMQDKEPLMRAISKLVNTVQPNLVLFVGEALVGNEAVDQLTKFNQALLDAGSAIVPAGAKPRLIDGIVLTKFDTVDDKVGSAISMVYTTGVPIVFVGTGQHYTDLKKLQVTSVVNTLLR